MSNKRLLNSIFVLSFLHLGSTRSAIGDGEASVERTVERVEQRVVGSTLKQGERLADDGLKDVLGTNTKEFLQGARALANDAKNPLDALGRADIWATRRRQVVDAQPLRTSITDDSPEAAFASNLLKGKSSNMAIELRSYIRKTNDKELSNFEKFVQDMKVGADRRTLLGKLPKLKIRLHLEPSSLSSKRRMKETCGDLDQESFMYVTRQYSHSEKRLKSEVSTFEECIDTEVVSQDKRRLGQVGASSWNLQVGDLVYTPILVRDERSFSKYFAYRDYISSLKQLLKLMRPLGHLVRDNYMHIAIVLPSSISNALELCDNSACARLDGLDYEIIESARIVRANPKCHDVDWVSVRRAYDNAMSFQPSHSIGKRPDGRPSETALQYFNHTLRSVIDDTSTSRLESVGRELLATIANASNSSTDLFGDLARLSEPLRLTNDWIASNVHAVSCSSLIALVLQRSGVLPNDTWASECSPVDISLLYPWTDDCMHSHKQCLSSEETSELDAPRRLQTVEDTVYHIVQDSVWCPVGVEASETNVTMSTSPVSIKPVYMNRLWGSARPADVNSYLLEAICAYNAINMDRWVFQRSIAALPICETVVFAAVNVDGLPLDQVSQLMKDHCVTSTLQDGSVSLPYCLNYQSAVNDMRSCTNIIVNATESINLNSNQYNLSQAHPNLVCAVSMSKNYQCGYTVASWFYGQFSKHVQVYFVDDFADNSARTIPTYQNRDLENGFLIANTVVSSLCVVAAMVWVFRPVSIAYNAVAR